MTKILTALFVLTQCGCGLETATTAATGAAIKKLEIEQGQKTLQQAQQKIDQAVAQTQQRAQDADEAGR